MNEIELVVFDVAGTTVRDDGGQVARCFGEALSRAGVDPSREEINRVMGLAKPVAIRALLEAHRGGVASPEEVDDLHDDFVQRMIAHYRFASGVAEIDGAVRTFERLRAAGVKVALDTGFDREILGAVLERLGWHVGATVDAIVASDEVEHGRPAADLIHEAMRRVGLAPSAVARVCKVGDTPSDLAEGAAAGCGLVVGVGSGTHAIEELRVHPHTHVVGSITELPGLLLHLDPEAEPVPIHRSIFGNA